MVEYFRHPDGLLYFRPFWHLDTAVPRIHLVRGALRGEGPWKVGDSVIRVLGCHGTDPGLAQEFASWQSYLLHSGDHYPAANAVANKAREHGAEI